MPPPNNLLNFGYALVRSIMARSLVISGLLPTLGIHHHNRYNAFCLADDMMEPFRPYVDLAVLEIVQAQKGKPLPDDLTREHKAALLRILAQDVRIDDITSPLMIAAQRVSASLVKCFEGSERKLVLPTF